MTGHGLHLTTLWTPYWAAATAFAVPMVFALRLRAQVRQQTAERWRERRMREELEAYARVDTSMAVAQAGGMDRVEAAKALSKRICRVIADKSAFSRVGMMLRDAEGRLYCAGSVGVDDLTVKALDAWATRVVEEERGGVPGSQSEAGPAAVRSGVKSFAIALGEWSRFDPEVAEWRMAGKRERRRWRRALVAPVRLASGRMAGAMVVCADGPRGGVSQHFTEGLERAMGPIEALAARLASSVENETLGERLQRAEKLAGLGQLAGGVAHALNNPLTAVLGFAELIVETSGDLRVRQDAETIRAEALKMKDTVQRLVEFWRPVTAADEGVDVARVVEELATECRGKLRERLVDLQVQAGDDLQSIRGSSPRLRQLLEHLLNNAAQAIAVAQASAAKDAGAPHEPEDSHAIRITVTDDGRTVHIIVSDTGTGFEEPARAFDPFYTTKGPEAGAGLGLSICYGIVREHGGEISAFNLHPRGAAVVIELPAAKTVRGPSEPVVRESAILNDSSPVSAAVMPRHVPASFAAMQPRYGFDPV